jgi:O-antigen/teichoic acid export membrane protein
VHKIKEYLGEASWITLGQILIALGGLAGIRLLTNVLPPESYGELGLGMAIASFISQIIYWPISNGATRLYSVAENKLAVFNFVSAINEMLKHAAFVVYVVFAFCFFFNIFIFDSLRAQYFVALLFYTILSGCGSVYAGILNASRRRAAIAISQSIEVWARFILAFLLISLFGGLSEWALTGFAIVSTIVVFWQYRRVSVSGDQIYTYEIGKDAWKIDIKRYIRPFFIIGLFVGVGAVSDRLILNAFASKTEVGLYVVLYQLGFYPITIITGVLVAFIEPIIYQRIGAGDNKEKIAKSGKVINIIALFMLGFSLFAALLASILSDLIFFIFTEKSYYQVSDYLPIVVLSGGLFAAGNALALKIQAYQLSSRLMAPKIGMAIFGVFANSIGAYGYGLKGVVCAGLATSSFYLLMVYLNSRGLGNE